MADSFEDGNWQMSVPRIDRSEKNWGHFVTIYDGNELLAIVRVNGPYQKKVARGMFLSFALEERLDELLRAYKLRSIDDEDLIRRTEELLNAVRGAQA